MTLIKEFVELSDNEKTRKHNLNESNDKTLWNSYRKNITVPEGFYINPRVWKGDEECA